MTITIIILSSLIPLYLGYLDCTVEIKTAPLNPNRCPPLISNSQTDRQTQIHTPRYTQTSSTCPYSYCQNFYSISDRILVILAMRSKLVNSSVSSYMRRWLAMYCKLYPQLFLIFNTQYIKILFSCCILFFGYIYLQKHI